MPDTIDRRKVTMTSYFANPDGSVSKHESEDFVAVEDIDAYVETKRQIWQSIVVGNETDHGPGGPSGDYTPITKES